MTRALTPEMIAALTADSGEWVKLIQLEFASATVYLTTAAQDIAWNGQTWQGVGGHISAEDMKETANPEAPGCRLMVSGVDQSIIAIILSDNYRGRRATVYEAHLDPAAGTVIDDPIIVFDGYMNESFGLTEHRDENGSGWVDIETRLTDKVSDLVQRRGVLTNVHSHQREIPSATGDTFFQHTPGLAGKRFYWGSKTPGTIIIAGHTYGNDGHGKLKQIR